MHSTRFEETSGGEHMERRRILVVGNGCCFSEEVTSYAVHLAERLDYDLVVLSVDTTCSGEPFRKKAIKAAQPLKTKAAEKGIVCDHTVMSGDLGQAVEEVQHQVKRIEFVVTDSQVNKAEIAREVTVPMFSIVSDSLDSKGGMVMANEQIIEKRKPVAQVVGYGALTAVLYATAFLNADTLMQVFTRGGWYASLPIATVFAFSFAHGAFASHLWSLLGIDALKRDALRQTERAIMRKKKTAKKRPRAYAYVNPFHRIDR